MKEILKCAMQHNIWFHILAAFSVILLIASFIVPPTGEISPSVLAGVGEVFGFAALGSVIYAIDKGKSVEMTHGSTTITVRKRKEESEESDENIPEEE